MTTKVTVMNETTSSRTVVVKTIDVGPEGAQSMVAKDTLAPGDYRDVWIHGTRELRVYEGEPAADALRPSEPTDETDGTKSDE
jgi:hypothetical protein